MRNNAPRPFTAEELDIEDTWSPYPLSDRTQPAYRRRRFDEVCNLSVLTCEMLGLLYNVEGLKAPLDTWEKAKSLSDQMTRWYEALPECLAAKDKAPQHMFTLQ